MKKQLMLRLRSPLSLSEAKGLVVAWLVALVFIASGCTSLITNINKSTDAKGVSLEWYIYHWTKDDAEIARLKAEYQQEIEEYLQAHPQTSQEIADNMRNCTVKIGMTEEQVLTMAKPHYILRGRKKNEKIFKYSDVGKFKVIKFTGEGTKTWITLTHGVVTNMREVISFMGY